jgi:hypothetical protein
MNKKVFGALVIFGVLVVACSSGGTTGTADDTVDTIVGGSATTGAAGSDAALMTEVEAIQAQLAGFAAEVEASAPESVQSAFTQVQDEVANLLPAASDLTLTADEIAPVTEAAEEFSQAVTDDGVQLSDAFMDFWSNLSSRLAALAS